MDEQMIQRLIEVQNRSVRVLEEIAQLIARLDKRTPSSGIQNVSTNPETSFTSVNLPSQINISNIPLPVNIENQPVSVEQSGSWSVSISDQPILVSPSDEWSISVEFPDTPIQVSQSGTWTVGIGDQPVSVTVTNTPLEVSLSPSPVMFATINATAAGDTQIVSAVSGKRIRVVAYAISSSATINIKFRSGTTDITGILSVTQRGVTTHSYDGGLFQTAVGQPLNINLSAAATVGGYVVYRLVD